MAGKCKTCEVCTRSILHKILGEIFFIFIFLPLLSWNYGLVKRRCPTCNHFLSKHSSRRR